MIRKGFVVVFFSGVGLRASLPSLELGFRASGISAK